MVAPDVELAQLIARGDTIAAIKLLREHTGMGLAAARDAVERARVGEPIAAAGAAAAAETPIDATVRELAERGQRIAAIRRLRQLTGLGLKDAKDRLDRAFGPSAALAAGGARVLLVALAVAVAIAWLALR